MADIGHIEPIAAEGNEALAVVSDVWHCIRCRFVHLPFPLSR